MKKENHITIFDTTLRDGEQSPGCSMNLEEKIKIFEVLESFAINHRKKTSNLEAHRYGLKKFITNFKMGMVNYFGFSCGGDDDFLDTLLELKIFKLDKGIVNETVL